MAKANKIVRNGKSLIVVLGSSGAVLTHNNCTDDIYNKIVNAETDDEIRDIIEPKKAEVVKKVVEVQRQAEEFEQAIKKSKILTIFHSSIYWKDVCEVSLPRDFAETVLTAEREGNQEYLQALRNFWVLCSLNPDSRARNNLFWFLTRYGFKISKNGLFVAYRNVDIKTHATVKKVVNKIKKVVENEEPEFIEEVEEEQVELKQNNTLNTFISSEFTRVRFKLKKAAKNFYVGKVKDDKGVESYVSNIKKEKVGEFIGMLDKLYEGLMNAKPEEVVKKVATKPKTKSKDKVVEEVEEEVVEEVQTAAVYTDAYTKSMTIMIGQTVSIDRSKCNPDQSQTCSHGLHVAGRKWLGDGYLGKTSLITLINPADVVAVPPEDSYGKMRVCAYFPLAVIERVNGKLVDPEFEDGFDDDFVKVIIDGYSVNNDDETKNYTLVTPSVYEFDPRTVKRNLEAIKNNLSKKMS